MADYYNMILDENELHWFFDHIIQKPLEYETYMIMLACRGKKLTDEEREYTKVGSRGEMMREELIRCKGGCHASHTSRRIWLDFDMDIKKECRTSEVFEEVYTALHSTGKKLFGLGNFAI